MSSVLVSHPLHGSLWLENCEIEEQNGELFVIGDVWDGSDTGSPNLPYDYRGQNVTMWFSVNCIRKDPDKILEKYCGRENNNQ